MAKLPEPQHTTVAKIYQHYEDNQEDGRRPHLGASLIGRPCERQLWYTFRWATITRHGGLLLRLFETGQMAEARFVKNLRDIGVEVMEVNPATGKQWSVSDFGGHFGGSMDGAALGITEAPKTWHVLELKTHSAKSFADLVKNGVVKSKPEHHAQMMTYMGYTGMERAAYMAVNKDTDELYFERIDFDPVEFAKIKARAERIIRSAEPPLRISNDPSWYLCRFCDFHAICHESAPPQANCRTCAHSTPELDGDRRWSCAHYKADISLDAQKDGCPQHRYIPLLVDKTGAIKDVVDGDVVYESGLVNGNGAGACTSEELSRLESLAIAPDACKLKAELAAAGIGSEVVR